MSSLVSLQLLGVRSFGPDEEDAGVIKFMSPITLILGQNGCGKTTLIESLKFATCGEVPESTNRGKDFLYNPHLAGTLETRGFVKLKCIDINGDTLLVTRPMQVTQKQKNLEFKRLESAMKLTKKGTNESTSLSSRCSDIDNLVTSSLGVSKAILTNVIFCHQEDSCWPLEEGKKVKERFDAIFDAKKYNTCLENIKKLRKDRITEIKLMKNDLQHLSERREEASSKRATLSETESRMAASRDEVKSLKEKLLPVSSRLREIAEKEDSIGKLQTEYETQKTRLVSVQEMINDLKSRIEFEFSGTDDELEKALYNFQEEFSQKRDMLKNIDKKITQLDLEIKRNKEETREEEVKLSQLARDNDRYTERLECRNKNLSEICNDLQIDNVSLSQLTERASEADRAIVLVKKSIEDKQEDVADMKSEHEAIINQLQSEIDEIRERKVKTESMITHKKQSIVNTHKECDKLNKTIDDVDKSAESLSRLESKLEKVNRELDNLNSSYDLNGMESEMKEKKLERSRLEGDLENIEKEVQSVQKISGLKTEIDLQKEFKLSKEGEIKKLLRRHTESLNQLLGGVPEYGIKLQFQASLSKLSEELRSKRDEIKVAEKDVTKLETEKRHLLDKLREARQSFTSDECLIEQECGNKEYDICLSELSSQVQELQDQKGTLSSSEYMFKRYVQKLEHQDPCCPLCHRDFSNEDEVKNLVLELSLKMRELPSKLRISKEKLEEAQEKYKKLLQLKPKYDKLSNMKNTEIPGLQGDLEKTEQQFGKAQKKLNELQKELTELTNNEDMAKSIQGDVILLEQYGNDAKKLDREIQKLESKLPLGCQKRNLEEALEEQELLRSKVASSRQAIEDLQSTLNKVSSRKQNLQQEKNSVQSEQMKISGNAQMRSQLVEKLKENKNNIATFQMDIDKHSEELIELSNKLEESSCHIKTQLAGNTKTLQETISQLKLIEQKFKGIKEIHIQILQFEKTGGTDKMKTVQSNVATLRKSGEVFLEKKATIISEQAELKSYLTSQQSRERDLEDNVKLRTKIVEETELNKKIKSLKLYIGSMDYVSIQVEKNKLRLEEDKINKDKARAEGRQRELENTISSIKIELNKDSYKNADKNYRDKLIQIKVEESSVDDLNKFYIALDWALTHFHQEKMKAINSTIRDLWRQIYQGNDIDSIEIKADIDVAASADKRRTYNYRLVQKKSGVEMEMRGRCSAGQKVLACLIIRMALAETFSANCGVLALDEPTTNLDESNIHSLSEALVDIVNQRSRQKNFQLIIISHDKAFLEVLQRIDKAQHYYKISRNYQGRSRIEKLHVHGMDAGIA